MQNAVEDVSQFVSCSKQKEVFIDCFEKLLSQRLSLDTIAADGEEHLVGALKQTFPGHHILRLTNMISDLGTANVYSDFVEWHYATFWKTAWSQLPRLPPRNKV